jgi:hypothetical protein
MPFSVSHSRQFPSHGWCCAVCNDCGHSVSIAVGFKPESVSLRQKLDCAKKMGFSIAPVLRCPRCRYKANLALLNRGAGSSRDNPHCPESVPF